MKLIYKLVKLHERLFIVAMFFTLLTVLINLCWNSFLAELINAIGNLKDDALSSMPVSTLICTIIIILCHALSEFASSYLSVCTCEVFAHELRMGYVRFYLCSDIRVLSKLNAGEEQSAMQNELSEITAYLNENLFSLVRQLVTFVFTVLFLFWRNWKLVLLFILPVVPLMMYCFVSGRMIKGYTEQCQEEKQKINGLTGTILELFPVIQVYSAHKLIGDVIDNRLLAWQASNIRKERISARLMSLSGVLSFVPLLLLLGIGGSMVINGEISLGVFYIFINLSGNVSGFLQNMPNIYAGFRRFRASVDRLEKKLVLPEGSQYVSICSLFR